VILIKKLYRFIFFSYCCLLGAVPGVYATSHQYKIAVVHSYERNYRDAGRYRRVLEKELKANGLNVQIRELFLNCDELGYEDELARASSFIDESVEWQADLIAIFNNQALFSFMKCANPRLHDIPVVFAGAYFPDEELIRQYPNVTGYVDIPDYVRTIRMIERLMGTCRIAVMAGKGMVDGSMWKNLVDECREAGIETYEGDAFSHVWAHRVIQNTDKEGKGEFYNEQIDTTVVMCMMTETMPLRTIQQVARGSETYLMLTSRTYNNLDAPDFFTNPTFGVINEGFGSNEKMLGGYFAPLETLLKDMAGSIARRLRGEIPEQQLTQSRKEYVLNWNVLQRYGISAEDLPAEYKVMYIPFSERYKYYILSGYILGGILLVSVIVFLTYSLSRERRRKRKALRDLKLEHQTLKLAIEGGNTYAWRFTNGNLSFDSHFYKLIGCPRQSVTMKQILDFVHPDDKRRFIRNFQREEKLDAYRGEYKCRFGGQYQWWEFRYSLVTDNGHTPVVTGLLQNIQETKNHEAELIRARQLAERAELKQSFLNNMSHEIRTPLNAIVGFSNLLIDNPDLTDQEKQEFIKLINKNNDLLLKLINDILELSRIDSGSISFTEEELDLRSLLLSYYQTFSLQIKPELEFLQDFPDSDVSVMTDPMRLQQVVTNFLTNANKFTSRGYIKLGYRLLPGGNEVGIFVEDSGKGIPSDELKMIFSRFYKHDEFAQGTGLGLSICQSIVERMQGRIEVDSEEGSGSRFTIVLSLIRSKSNPE
jgi:PAS domain S-box-containing protein